MHISSTTQDKTGLPLLLSGIAHFFGKVAVPIPLEDSYTARMVNREWRLKSTSWVVKKHSTKNSLHIPCKERYSIVVKQQVCWGGIYSPLALVPDSRTVQICPAFHVNINNLRDDLRVLF